MLGLGAGSRILRTENRRASKLTVCMRRCATEGRQSDAATGQSDAAEHEAESGATRSYRASYVTGLNQANQTLLKTRYQEGACHRLVHSNVVGAQAGLATAG